MAGWVVLWIYDWMYNVIMTIGILVVYTVHLQVVEHTTALSTFFDIRWREQMCGHRWRADVVTGLFFFFL